MRLGGVGPEGFRQPPAADRAAGIQKCGERMLRWVDRKLHLKRSSREVSFEALKITATVVGAVVLGRLVGAPALASRLLDTVRRSRLS
jgi:hypothetical protein